MGFMDSKGLVLKNFTQNIDGLELKAHCNEKNMVFAHGRADQAHCPTCGVDVDVSKLKEYINDLKVMYCNSCNKPCKPKVVLYGEKLGEDFSKAISCLDECDLCIIMGTSLKVSPFNFIPNFLNKDCHKLLINMERVGNLKLDDIGSKDVFVKGYTDDAIVKLIKDFGLKEEFDNFMMKHKED